MAKSAMIRARIEPKLKQRAEKVLGGIGLSPTTAVTLLYKAIVIQNGLPLDLHIPNAETRRAMRDAKMGRGLTKADSLEELIRLLDAPGTRKKKKRP
jgi:DNA-damage-inducible protein J